MPITVHILCDVAYRFLLFLGDGRRRCFHGVCASVARHENGGGRLEGGVDAEVSATLKLCEALSKDCPG